MKPEIFRRLGIAVLLVTLAMLLTGCPGDGESRREKKFREWREQMSGQFFLGAMVYVAAAFAGPTVAEFARKEMTNHFKLTLEDQVQVARVSYWSIFGMISLLSIFNNELSAAQPTVWLLLAASAYPFHADVLPSLVTQDKARRKAALAQMKTFLMLIFVFYVILKLLSPAGFGKIQLQ